MLTRKATLTPEVYLSAERQQGNFSQNNLPAHNWVFIGLLRNFGAGLSSWSEVSGAQARLASAQANVESARVELGEQILGDAVLATAGSARKVALAALLRSSQAVPQVWGLQFLVEQKSSGSTS